MPVDAVGRGKGVKPAGGRALVPIPSRLLQPRERFVAGVGRGLGILVDEGCKVVRLDPSPDHVVILRSIDLDESELGPGEVNAVATLGNARYLVVGVIGAGH